jgi:hypothetical protein
MANTMDTKTTNTTAITTKCSNVFLTSLMINLPSLLIIQVSRRMTDAPKKLLTFP